MKKRQGTLDINQNLDVSCDLNSTVNESLTPSRLVTSTPFKVPTTGPKKRPRRKGFVREVCDTCPQCGQEYRCHRSFLKHMRKHSIEDAASRFPNQQQIIDHCVTSSFNDIAELSFLPAFSESGEKYKELIAALKPAQVDFHSEWGDFLDIIFKSITRSIGDKKILLPSAMVNTLVANAENLLSDLPKRRHLLDLLQVCVSCDDSVGYIFIADYILLLVKKILKFYSSLIKVSVVEQPGEKEVVLDTEDKECIHYVSGSVVRAFYRKGQMFPKHTRWSKISKVIAERLLENENVPGPPAIYKGWTTAKSRGKLFFVSGLLFDFFVGVADILERISTVKIDNEKVIESVCERGIMLLWDDAVGDSLTEKCSYDLMCGMVRSFCNVYGIGRAKRIMNNFRKNKAEASIPLRHRVAPKS